MGQFLGPETDVMGERYFMELFYEKKLNLQDVSILSNSTTWFYNSLTEVCCPFLTWAWRECHCISHYCSQTGHRLEFWGETLSREQKQVECDNKGVIHVLHKPTQSLTGLPSPGWSTLLRVGLYRLACSWEPKAWIPALNLKDLGANSYKDMQEASDERKRVPRVWKSS